MEVSTTPTQERRGLRTDLLIAFLYLIALIGSLVLNRVGLQAETTVAMGGFWNWLSLTLTGSLVVLGLCAYSAAIFQLYETWVPKMNGLWRVVANFVIGGVVAVLLFLYLQSLTVSAIAGGIVTIVGLWYSDETRLKGRQKASNYNDNHAAIEVGNAFSIWMWSVVVCFVGFGILALAKVTVELNLQWQFMAFSIFKALAFGGVLLLWHLILGGWAATMRDNTPAVRWTVPPMTGLVFFFIAPLLGVSNAWALPAAIFMGITMLAATDWPGSRKVTAEAAE